MTEPERELLNAKANELIARYGIVAAMLAAEDPKTDQVGDRVITVGAPYAMDKISLLFAIAAPLRIRMCAGKQPDGTRFVHLFGYGADLERVEILYTSLLLQAIRGLLHAGPMPGESVKAFRRTSLAGFADAVGQRLRKAEDDAAATTTPNTTRAIRSACAGRPVRPGRTGLQGEVPPDQAPPAGFRSRVRTRRRDESQPRHERQRPGQPGGPPPARIAGNGRESAPLVTGPTPAKSSQTRVRGLGHRALGRGYRATPPPATPALDPHDQGPNANQKETPHAKSPVDRRAGADEQGPERRPHLAAPRPAEDRSDVFLRGQYRGEVVERFRSGLRVSDSAARFTTLVPVRVD